MESPGSDRRSAWMWTGVIVAIASAVGLAWKMWRRALVDPKTLRAELSSAVIREAVLDLWRQFDVEGTGYLQLEEARGLTFSMLYNLSLDKTVLTRYVDALFEAYPSHHPLRSVAQAALRKEAVNLHVRREEVFREVKARVGIVNGERVVGSELVTALSIWLESTLYLQVLTLK